MCYIDFTNNKTGNDIQHPVGALLISAFFEITPKHFSQK